ncbi:MAG: PAS domain-containing protein [Croceitalea sp.]|nr:PAS domain-containing protein [Croceitalea sp.]NNC33279.1 PAS domain-containing protein [Croceitalea sp.]NNL09790.1 PAS domain-containing protein [Croceitalea sp.]NNM17056.1 PAS domain-containing protein [Croceitalea sp.]
MNELHRTYQQIFDSNNNYDGKHVKNYIQKLEELNSFLPPLESFILITNTSNGRYEFISNNFEKTLGLDRDKMMAEGLNYYLSFYHPDDLPILLKVFEELMVFTMENLSLEERKNVIYTWKYRVKNGKGVYKNMHVQQTPIFFDPNGRPIIGYSHNTIIGENKPIPIIGSCKLLNNKNEYETIFQKNYSMEHFHLELSNRETDVVRLMATSNSTKKIAEKLNISPNTVEVHRKNILQKLDFETTAEIIEYCNKYHFY